MKLTPMMRQYRETKDQYPDCLLMFRVGDFFELFFEDAVTAARELNIALTSRDKKEGEEGTPMAGVPHHALEAYLGRLVKRGYKVAICDQVEDPQEAKGLVQREVVRVVTPGTIIEDNLLEPTRNNWLLALVQEGEAWGLAYADISTAQFQCSQFRGSRDQAEAIIASLNPTEILVEDSALAAGFRASVTMQTKIACDLSGLPQDHFLYAKPLAAQAVGVIFSYLGDKHIQPPVLAEVAWYDPDSFLYLDATSQRNLEILSSLDQGAKGPSLLKVVDKTITAMGGRMLKNILVTPLASCEGINRRLDWVEYFLTNYITRKKSRELLRDIYDLERILTKVRYGTVNARDMLALANSLRLIPALANIVAQLPWNVADELGEYQELCDLLDRAIFPDPPATIRDGNVIRAGYSQELDEVRALAANAGTWIKEYEASLRDVSGIKSLKIGYNKVFGYYIEVTRANISLVPGWFERKQTLVNSERFETKELKEWEDKILSATERIHNLEYQLFCQVRESVADWIPSIQTTARTIAALDCWLALAEVAEECDYCRPLLEDSTVLEIRDGRHPVVERFGKREFVANDCYLDTESRQIMIITGPNMAGKSTYMRQVALIALLAHVGSFVPASFVRIGIMDAIFTRIGASDDLASGRSTFMVEMSELARILQGATPKSLILLDEIGRGTGTADGISIARATLEYLHETSDLTAKTLFATHYHKLITLADSLSRVVNCSVQVSEKEGEVTFLHKIIPGGSDRSYGIHVAKLAGLPQSLVSLAEMYLDGQQCGEGEYVSAHHEVAAVQERQNEDVIALLGYLRDIDPDELTPRQAWAVLERLKNMAREVVGQDED